jgi:cytochrome c biogenesis factor
MLLLLGFSALLKTKKINIIIALIIATIAAITLFFVGMKTIIELVFFFACVFAIVSQLQSLLAKIMLTKKIKLNYLSSFLSHIGLAIFLVGAVLYGAFREDEIVFLEKNKLIETKNGFQCIITKIDNEIKQKYFYIVPNIDVKYKKNNFILKPKIVFTRIIDKNEINLNSNNKVNNNDNDNLKTNYQKSFGIHLHPDVANIVLTDIYIEPINSPTSNGLLFLISVKPYIKLVWVGFATLLCGLIMSLIPHRNRDL